MQQAVVFGVVSSSTSRATASAGDKSRGENRDPASTMHFDMNSERTGPRAVAADAAIIPVREVWNQAIVALVGKDGAHGVASHFRIVQAGDSAKTVPAKIRQCFCPCTPKVRETLIATLWLSFDRSGVVQIVGNGANIARRSLRFGSPRFIGFLASARWASIPSSGGNSPNPATRYVGLSGPPSRHLTASVRRLYCGIGSQPPRYSLSCRQRVATPLRPPSSAENSLLNPGQFSLRVKAISPGQTQSGVP